MKILRVYRCRLCPFVDFDAEGEYCDHPDGPGEDIDLNLYDDDNPIPTDCPLRKESTLVELADPK